MKKNLKKIISILIILTFLIPGMSFGQITDHGSYYVWDGNAYLSSNQDDDQIAIIYTGNMQGRFEAKGKEASMGRVMTQITKLRREYEDSYLIDAGNFTADANNFGSTLEKSFELKAMETMAYDVVGLGAKELSQGINAAANYMESAIKDKVNSKDYFAYPSLACANLDWDKISNGELKRAFNKFTPQTNYALVEKYGSSLAIVGVTDIKQDILSNASAAANTAIKQIKKENKKIDGIVLVYNGDNVETIAKDVKNVDLIISNPSKSQFKQEESAMEREPAVINNIPIVETMGIEGVGQIVFEKSSKGLKLESLTSYLIDDELYENSAITDINDDYIEAVDKSYFGLYGFSQKTALTTNHIHFKESKVNENSSLGDLISDAYKRAGKHYSDESAELAGAFFASGTLKGTLEKGEVHPEDLYRMFDNSLSSDGLTGSNLVDVYVSGAELKILAEIDASIAGTDENVKLYFSGIKYQYNPHRFYRNRVSDVYINDDESVAPRALYRVITDEKTIQLIEEADKAPFGLMDIQFKNKDGKPLNDTKDAVINYKGHPVKQWVCLAKYIDDKGISSSYETPSERKILDDNKSLKAIFSNPGKVFLVSLLAAIIVIAFILVIILLVLKALGLSRNSFYRRHRRENRQKSIFKHRRSKYNRKNRYRNDNWFKSNFRK